ncbi:hypothetical protein BDC45DRAFT_86332 [Circinella umbellata]|nr:hypothetical protein BDC45DRAFT_86332 [Circinella umbellata]
MITNSETWESVSIWLSWLKNTIKFTPSKIMIDCSPVEIKAIHDVYSTEVQVLLYHCHIKKIKVNNSSKETEQQQDQAHTFLNLLVESTTAEMFDENWRLFGRVWGDEKNYVSFYAYMLDNWYEKRGKWRKAWRKDASYHTNNLVESWHNRLKTFYLGKARNHRVDRIIYILTDKVELDFRKDALQVKRGIIPVWLSAKERKRRQIAYELDDKDANDKLMACDGQINPPLFLVLVLIFNIYVVFVNIYFLPIVFLIFLSVHMH